MGNVHQYLVDGLSNWMSGSKTFRQGDYLVRTELEKAQNATTEFMLNSPSFQEADKVARSGFGSMMNGYYLIVDRVGQFMSKSPWFQSFDKFLNDPEGQQLMAANAKGYYDSMVNTASTFIEAEEQAKNRTKDVIVDTIVQKVWKVQADYLADGIDYLVENNKKTAAYLVATNPNIKV
ncbi:MAG: hypothetical protein KDD35_11655, partial [Bdellovibrionales bacterium]|nr:hypothetical protein [Bdellovibrionales bacterium]